MLLKKQENIVDLQTFLAWRRSESVEEWRKSDYSQFSAACTSGHGSYLSPPCLSASKLATAATRTNAISPEVSLTRSSARAVQGNDCQDYQKD